jgi:DNA-binding beta-propeller fold protein YncE
MSDAGWAITEATLPEPAWKQGRGGRPAERCRHDIIDAIRYLVKEGIQWRATGFSPVAIAITPDGTTAYVLGSSSVTPIRTATNTALAPIKVGCQP